MNQARSASEIIGIQYLRAIAATAVLVHHLLETVGATPFGRAVPDWLVTGGAAGVDLFFVISGFIMLHVSFPPDRPAATPGNFLLRRVTRIYPLYWVVCLMVISLGAVGFYSKTDFSAGAVAASLALLPSHFLVGVSWTLSYEMLFYLVFALALFARSVRTVVIVSTLLLVLVFVAANLMLPEGPWRTFFARPILFEFVCGMAAALAFRIWGTKATLPLWCGVAGMLVLLTIPALTGFPNTHGLAGWTRFFAWGLPSVVVLMAVLNLRPSTGLLARIGELLGDASYAIYLFHPLIATAYSYALVRWLAPVPTLLTFTAAVVGSLIGGVILHLLIEKPVLVVVRKLLALRLPHAIISRQSLPKGD